MKEHYADHIKKVKAKLQSWKGNMLSYGGKETTEANDDELGEEAINVAAGEEWVARVEVARQAVEILGRCMNVADGKFKTLEDFTLEETENIQTLSYHARAEGEKRTEARTRRRDDAVGFDRTMRNYHQEAREAKRVRRVICRFHDQWKTRLCYGRHGCRGQYHDQDGSGKELRVGVDRVNGLLVAHAQDSDDYVAAMRRGRCINKWGRVSRPATSQSNLASG
uniref:Uncharacterized protein n=1 Tax=Solanum tuberosum TaxID=4113 RepID=M1B264_SOLTU